MLSIEVESQATESKSLNLACEELGRNKLSIVLVCVWVCGGGRASV